MFDFFKKATKEVQDLKLDSVVSKNRGIQEIRKNTEILFIDDENLDVIPILKDYKYNITYKSDIDTINDVQAYDIILCDVRGVGKKFSSEYEGAFLIREIKANFPNKIVIAYTASTYDANYNEYLKDADEILTKGKRIDDWVETLDRVINLAVNPIYQWKKTRKKLLENDVRLSSIVSLEDAYVKAIQNNDFNSFEELIKNIDAKHGNDKLSNILNSFLHSLIVKIIKEINE